MIDLNFVVPLNAPQGELGMMRVGGADAGAFLQGQLTQDVLLLQPGAARLAAWCSAKGRMVASFWVIKLSAEAFLLVLSRDLLESTLKRLKMFVLRAQCDLQDVSALHQMEGLLGEAAQHSDTTPDQWSAGVDAFRVYGQLEGGLTLRLPDGHSAGQRVPRALRIRIGSPAAMPAPQQHLDAWNALEISTGIARVSRAVSEMFVPQMLSYESVGGVNFKKGCYPGQEVVARSQFRGTIKRRAALLTCDAAMAAGQEVYEAGTEDAPCGQIAQAAAHPSGGFIAIAALQTSSQDAPLALGAAGGAPVQRHALPYRLVQDL